MAKSKPIRIFWSGLSKRFYASRAYKEIAPGTVEITGEKFDVTDDIGSIIERYGVTFEPGAEHTIVKDRHDKAVSNG